MRRFICLTLLLAGCGGGGNYDGPVAPAPVPSPVQVRVARIGVIAPLEAGLTEFGRGIRNSAQLAVNQANANNAIPGWRLELVAKDDSSTPAKGAQAANELATDPALIGVVGTYNSGVAAQVMPVLSPQNIVMISPANTDPTLTEGHPFATYFRVVASDSFQGPQLAQYAFDTLGIRRAAVVSETKSVSQGLANAFVQAFTARGGTITIQRVVPDGTTDYGPTMAAVAATQPALLFYGGEYTAAAAAKKAAVAAGIGVPLMGGDGIKDQAYITGAGSISEGDYASSVGAPVTNLPNASGFVRDYAAAGFTDPPSDYGPYAFDATNILINSARAGLTAGAVNRGSILSNVQATNTTGITGPLGFNANGDTINKVLTFYRVIQNRFAPLTTVTVQ